jgi:hypothetical protein
MPQHAGLRRLATFQSAPVGIVSLISLVLAAPAAAQPVVFPNDPPWTVAPSFGTATEGRNNVSGATCMDPPSKACLVVNDAAKFAQLFAVVGTAIRPGSPVGLTSDPTNTAGTVNAEGAGHDNQFFYVVTSRGRVGSTGQVDPSFAVIRFTPDAANRPPGPLPPGPIGNIQLSNRIRDALTAGIPIPQIAGAQLDRTNAQIEGIAVKDGVLHLGFRAPVISGKAFIVSAPVQAMFGTGALNATVHLLALGPDTGIRDLATASDGLLVLAGTTRSLPGPASLFHWNDGTGHVAAVADFAQPLDRNVEALMLLQEDPEFYRVLLMFDGVPNGGPLEYGIPR